MDDESKHMGLMQWPDVSNLTSEPTTLDPEVKEQLERQVLIGAAPRKDVSQLMLMRAMQARAVADARARIGLATRVDLIDPKGETAPTELLRREPEAGLSDDARFEAAVRGVRSGTLGRDDLLEAGIDLKVVQARLDEHEVE